MSRKAVQEPLSIPRLLLHLSPLNLHRLLKRTHITTILSQPLLPPSPNLRLLPITGPIHSLLPRPRSSPRVDPFRWH